MVAQAKLFRAREHTAEGVVDEARKGWVVPFEGGQVRVHGRDRDGNFVAAVADHVGRDVRPLRFVVLPATHARLRVTR